MTRGRASLATATLTAVLGGIAFATGAALVAAVAGLCAIATASLAARGRTSDGALVRPRRAKPVEPAASPAAPPAPSIDAEPFTDHGVLSERFVQVTLEQRVAVARRALRPLSVVYLEVLGADTGDEITLRELVAGTIASTLRESDVVGRRDDGVYVFVLEDTGEDGAVWTAERMRRALAAATGRRRFRAGIAAYPSHGLDAPSLVTKAAGALQSAREWDSDRIEVATGS